MHVATRDFIYTFVKETMKTATLRELADLVNGTVSGDEQLTITGFNSLDLASSGDLSFINHKKMVTQLVDTNASACIAPYDLDDVELPLIQVENPDLASARIHQYLLEKEFNATGIHQAAVLGADCVISDQVSIGANVTIGDRVKIGDRVSLQPGVVIGDDVQIGADCALHANAVVAHGCILGNEVILFPGAVIGSDGFGFASDPATGNHVSKPQVGTVRLDDGVHIGANSCVDRAAFGTTLIKSGVRIDNQVMIGHNCVIGENSIIVGQAGIAGSSTLGRNVVLAARAAVSGHLHLDDGVVVAALGGVHTDLKKGEIVGGVPAYDVKKWGRASAAFRRLPDVVKETRRLRKEVDRLTALLEQTENGEK